TRVTKREYYADLTMTVLKFTYTYYNDSYNRRESYTLVAPDASGNIYYHYMNESYNRVDIIKRLAPDADGAISYKLFYPTTTSTRVTKREYYADLGLTQLIFTYTYYNDTYNRRESKTLPAPDSSGNIYYHYINENWASTGYGRVDKSKRSSALDGEISYTYTYFSGTAKAQYKYGYQNADWTVLVATYEYDSNSFLIKKTYANGDFITTSYWPSGNKKEDAFFGPGWVWKNTIQYYEDGVMWHYQWLADPNPVVSGDETYLEYDSLGRPIIRGFDDGSSSGITYYGTTTNKYQVWFNAPGGIWQHSIEYYEDGVTMHYHWISLETAPLFNNEVFHENNSSGLVLRQEFVNGNIIVTSYWGITSNIYRKEFYGPNWTWKNAV
ncbi:MAG: hypothetical protein Q8R48_04215, partial [Candidatus Omnitrophota bacterium]|nr:hypothetical protein [Candidatus Omnitrophota bacterium]